MRVFSHERTKIAYDGTPEADGQGLPEGVSAGQRVILEHGVNEVSPHGAALLAQDVNFKRHQKSGHVHVINEDGNAAPAGEDERPIADKRTVVKKEKAVKAPAPSADPTPEQKKAVDDYFAMAEGDREAYAVALSPEEKAIIAADPRSKPADA